MSHEKVAIATHQQFVLREGHVVKIANIPSDLTLAEVERLRRFLLALVKEEEPDEHLK